MTTYLGVPVLELVPTSTPWRRSIARQLDITGAQYGIQEGFTTTTVPRFRQTLEFLLMDRADVITLRDHFDLVAGRHLAFWLPTYDADIELKQDGYAGQTAVLSRNTGYAAVLWSDASKWRRALLFAQRTGTRQYNQVLSTTVTGSNALLTLSAALSVDFPAALTTISFLAYVHFDQDKLEIEWLARDLARVRVSVIEIPIEVATIIP